MCVNLLGGGDAAGGAGVRAAATINSLLCFSKSLHVWKGGKRSYCKNDVSFGFTGHLAYQLHFFIFFYLILLPFLPRPGRAQDTSAPRTVSGLKRTKSRPAPPRSLLPHPHSGATTRPRPLPLPHHLYTRNPSEGLMSPAPPPRPLPPPKPPFGEALEATAASPRAPPPLLAPLSFPPSLSEQITHPTEAGPPPSARRPISCPRNPLFVAVSGAQWGSPSPFPTSTQVPGVV